MTFSIENVKAFIDYVDTLSMKNGMLGPFYYPNTEIRQWNIVNVDDSFMLHLLKLSPTDHQALIDFDS